MHVTGKGGERELHHVISDVPGLATMTNTRSSNNGEERLSGGPICHQMELDNSQEIDWLICFEVAVALASLELALGVVGCEDALNKGHLKPK